MSSTPRTIHTLLITYPLEPRSLVDRLRQFFPRVAFYPGPAGNDYSAEAALLPPPPAEVLAEADALLCFPLPKSLISIEQMPRLKLLQTVGSGTAQVTGSEFWKTIPPEHPLILANAAGIHVSPIGEHVLMTSMMLLHRMQQVADITRGEQRWAHPAELGGLFVQELRGLTFGILGYGHIGREVARLATAFGCTILACTRSGQRAPIGGYHLPGTGDPEGDLPEGWYTTGEKKSVGEFLGRCDVVVDLLPSSEGMRRFVGEEELRGMKDTAIFINAGRGDTVDTEALITALQAELEAKEAGTGVTGSLRIAGAALDVTDPEPLPDGHALFSLPNVVLTPHCSWTSKKNFVRACDLLEENARRIDAGQGALNALRGKGEGNQ